MKFTPNADVMYTLTNRLKYGNSVKECSALRSLESNEIRSFSKMKMNYKNKIFQDAKPRYDMTSHS